MKPYTKISIMLVSLALQAAVSCPSLAQVQPTGTAKTAVKPTKLIASVEQAGNQVHVVLTNPSETLAFQGAVSVSLDISPKTSVPLPFTLAPAETRRLFIPGLKPSGSQYTLAVYDQTGALVLYKIAPLMSADRNEAQGVAERVSQQFTTNGIKVSALIPRSSANSEAELPSPEKAEALLLTFVIESATRIKDATFTLSGGNFKQSQKVTLQGRRELECKLPASSSERQFRYELVAEGGASLTRGDIDLDKLAAPDAVLVNELKFDHPVYAPGETARAIIEMQGDATRGYRLEVTVQEGETALFKDVRKGINVAGNSRQEFSFELPREVKGLVTLGFRVFGGQTGFLFDSGVREIVISETPPAKAGEGKRLAP